MRKRSATVIVCLAMVLFVAWAAPLMAEDMSKINLNTATKEQLLTLKGIGESYADRIIEYRQVNGPYKKPEDIMNVKGIGDKIYQNIKDRLVVRAE